MDGYRDSLQCKFHSRVKNLKRTISPNCRQAIISRPWGTDAIFMQHFVADLLSSLIPNRLKMNMKLHGARLNQPPALNPPTPNQPAPRQVADPKMNNNLEALSGDDRLFGPFWSVITVTRLEVSNAQLESHISQRRIRDGQLHTNTASRVEPCL